MDIHQSMDSNLWIRYLSMENTVSPAILFPADEHDPKAGKALMDIHEWVW